ncbi:hypothetical protein PPYR_01774 [Photinus pyralis]|uniref:Carbonyl reductase n=2 Tax=Photinus pyralis TaxID=7054 RepID=A0A5N4B5H7_PHOPY|nr:carbonyl reductase [NADPH] 1-like [Photinus pyralis]KAB0804804.1 hypothetical protein PPYR_01774 [Photinus pyralis]
MKVAVVTGANKGIGFEIVKALCQRYNGNVYLTARNAIKGNAAACKLKKLGLNPIFRQLDVEDEESIKRFRDYIAKREGGINLLFNNAGVTFDECTQLFSKEAEKVVNVNFFGTLHVSEILAPLLRYGARIINTSSYFGHLSNIPSASLRDRLASRNLTVDGLCQLMNEYLSDVRQNKHITNGWGDSPYNVSKVAVAALTIVLQRQFDNDPEKRQISVNSVHPGYSKTDLTGNTGTYTAEEGARPALFAALDAEGLRGQFVWENLAIIDWYSPNPPSF